jgi:hypothetical protein
MSDESSHAAPRLLTKHERILARHHLQVLSEQAQAVRNAMDPAYGRLAITDRGWAEQWTELTKHLDAYTRDVLAGKNPSGLWPADREGELGEQEGGGEGAQSARQGPREVAGDRTPGYEGGEQEEDDGDDE